MNYKYHFAISFSNKSRNEAQQIATQLRQIGYSVFYDKWYEHEMLGRNGADYLRQVYAKESKYCIVLVDADYDKRKWTNFEKDVIEGRAFQETSEILIPVMMEEYHPDWLPPTRIYCSFQEKGIEGIVALLARKLPLHSNASPVTFSKTARFKHDLVITKKSTGKQPRILIINTGGNIGVCSEDMISSCQPASWDELIEYVPSLNRTTFGIDMLSYTPILEAENVSFQHWNNIAQAIAVHYDEYEGFVVWHGSDTLAYSAAALSFILSNLEKPVILTSSALPIFEKRTDAINNILTSIEVAANRHSGIPLVPEVSVIGFNKVFRGNRVTNVSALSYHMFDSPNFPPLGTMGDFVNINTSLIHVPEKSGGFCLDLGFSQNVISIAMFPGISPELIRRMLLMDEGSAMGKRGIVLEIFGNGNAPVTSLLNVVDECVEREIAIVAIGRTPGGLKDIYSSQRLLFSRGVINGRDMTNITALIKLAWILDKGFPFSEMGRLMQTNFRGEITS
jgi:L-asparaginase